MKSVYLVYAIRLDSYFICKILTKKLDVLAQVHGDPLFRNREIKKLECFSKKRFGELKKAVRVLGRRKIIK